MNQPAEDNPNGARGRNPGASIDNPGAAARAELQRVEEVAVEHGVGPLRLTLQEFAAVTAAQGRAAGS